MINTEIVLVSIAILAGLVALVFWGSTAVHCYKNRELSPKQRFLWFLAIVLGKLFGAGAYYLLRYRQPSNTAPC